MGISTSTSHRGQLRSSEPGQLVSLVRVGVQVYPCSVAVIGHTARAAPDMLRPPPIPACILAGFCDSEWSDGVWDMCDLFYVRVCLAGDICVFVQCSCLFVKIYYSSCFTVYKID